MTALVWERLSGTVLVGRFELRELIKAGARFAVFGGWDKVSGKPILMQVFQNPDGPLLQRFQEARYLSHPNLLKVLAEGRDETSQLAYAASERPEQFLGQFLARRPVKVEDAIRVTGNLVDALAYLHSEGLVYCNLGGDTVCRIGGQWSLADFSQLRLPSQGDAKELRQSMVRNVDLPPEAFEGVVSPAWDVWTLGTLLRYAMTTDYPGAPRGRQLRGLDLPHPFDSIVRDCLEPDPAARISLEEVRRRLHEEPPAVRPPYVVPGKIPSDGLRKVPPGMAAVMAVAGGALSLALVLGTAALMGYGGTPGAPMAKPEVVTEADRIVQEPSPGRSVAAPLETEIGAVLNQWVESTRTRDAVAQAECYAPRVNVYFGRTNVSREQVKQDKRRLFESVGTVHQFDLGNVQIRRADPHTAVALFDKTWEFGDRSKFAGAERGQLTFRKLDGDWKIVGERELKVYWVRRPGEGSRNRTS